MTAVERPHAFSSLLAEFARLPVVALPSAYTRGLARGTKVGRFVIQAEIGRGGFGIVYEAYDPDLGRCVALKMLHPGRRPEIATGEWIQREAEAVARLSHPGIVTLFDFGKTEDAPFLVFELLRGETLASRIRRGPLTVEELVRIARSVSDALAHAHASNVLHRDLKPGNVFLCAGGGVKVLDFGIAHLFGRSDASRGGTPAYMAPEQWQDAAETSRTDLYALGIILIEMLTGRGPFDDEEQVSPTSRRRPTISRSQAPRALRRLVEELTAPRPEARPVSAEEVSRRLTGIQHTRRNRTRSLAITLGALALAVLSGVAWRSRSSPLPAERVTVAISDEVNRTNDRDFDHLSELLRSRLAESSRLRVLTAERLRLVGRRAGMPVVGALDPNQTRLLARAAGSDVMVELEIHASGASFLVHVRMNSVSPERPLLDFEAPAAGKDSFANTLAEVTARILGALDVPHGGASQAHAEATGNPAAFRQYAAGLDCIRHRSSAPGSSDLERCGPHFRKALEEDPTFPLAHFEIAVLQAEEAAPEPELRSHMDGLARSAGRLQNRDASVVQAWKAHLEGNDGQALDTYDRILAQHPDDLDVLFLAGALLYQRGDRTGAIPFLTKVLDLDPQHDRALEYLVDAYGATSRFTELGKVVDALTTEPPTPWRSHLLVRASIWLGKEQEAISIAKKAVESGGGRAAEEDLRTALVSVWDVKAVERITRKQISEQPRSHRAWHSLVTCLLAQGRVREATRIVHNLPSLADGFSPAELAYLRAMIAAAVGDWAHVEGEAQRLAAIDATHAQVPIILVALAGDRASAKKLATRISPHSVAGQEVEALLAWRAGRTSEAVAGLSVIEMRDPWPEDALPAAYLIAEVASAAGDQEEVISAVKRVRRLWPRGAWRAWGWPRALLLSARAHEALGDLHSSESEKHRLRQMLRYADRGLPIARLVLKAPSRLSFKPLAASFRR